MVLTIIALLALSAIGKAMSDTLQFNYGKSIFRKLNRQWWDPRVSWENKHQPRSYFVRLLMSTVLVFLTDGWHLAQFIQHKALSLAMALMWSELAWEYDFFDLHWSLWWLTISVIHQSVFHTVYHWVFRRQFD